MLNHVRLQQQVRESVEWRTERQKDSANAA
jgi:hypothetical protein